MQNKKRPIHRYENNQDIRRSGNHILVSMDSSNVKSLNKIKTNNKSKMKKSTIIGRIVLCFFSALLFIIILLYSSLYVIANGNSPTLRNQIVIMAKEASATKWIPELFLNEDTINEIIESKNKKTIETQTVDDYNDSTNENNAAELNDYWSNSIDGIKFETLNESTYKAYVLQIKDASRVFVGCSSSNYENATVGCDVFDIINKYGAIAAINAGEFIDTGGLGSGAAPMGLTYSQGECVWNDNYVRTFIGFDSNNNLIVKEKMTKDEADSLNIRDAVSFQNGNTLMYEENGMISTNLSDDDTGTSQRTAIGQKEDGTVIFIVTDGRTASSIGATRNDIINLMTYYKAVNAAMLDGGSSTMMYYENYYNLYNLDTSQFDEYQLKGDRKSVV